MSRSLKLGFVTLSVGSLVALACITGCSADPNHLDMNEDEQKAGDGDEGGLECTEKPETRAYVGFGKTDLNADRANEGKNLNRARVKPYSVLASEYKRVLGAEPAALKGAASAFGDAKPRWMDDEQSGSLEIDAMFDVAFDGCITLTKAGGEYGAAPNEETAKSNCTALANRFWNKAPSEEALTACTTYATTGLEKEPDPRRRWAYVCASVLTSSQFLTY
jgi:hypothetical protein